jgi:tetratricopeptide (TPR) repeat protein
MKDKGIAGRFLSPLLVLVAGAFFCQFLAIVNVAGAQIPNRSGNIGPGNIQLRMNDVDLNISCDELQRLIVNVVTTDNDKKVRLDRQSVVKLLDIKRDTTAWQTTDKESKITFCNIDFGDYEIEVSAVGYLTEQRLWHLAGTVQERKLEIALRKDPTAADLSAVDSAIPAQAQKDAKRAVDYLKSANFKEAQKRLERAYKVAPGSAQINFLLGFLYVELRNYEEAESFLSRSATIDSRRVQPLTLLGRVQLQREHNEDARKTLEKAVEDDPNSWMAHNLLADAYLRNKEYEKARDQAQLSIHSDPKTGTAALLVLGQALANLGHDEEGIQALNGFVQNNPNNPAVPQVKALVVQIEDRDVRGSGDMKSSGDLTLAAVAPSLPESAWGPPGVDDLKPPVAPDVTCPGEAVIETAGLRVKQLVDNIAQFAAVEDLVHEQLDKSGNPITKETRKFNYVASISEEVPGYLSTEEYRDLRYGVADLPDHIVTTGFVSLALIFHPDMRENFQMTCEGLGGWRGQPAWLVYFRQRDDKPNHFADYIVSNTHYPMMLKGRAWIAADNLQIVRIESDLVSPLPGLAVQHQIAEYGPVHFQSKKLDLWLPQSADIFLEMNRHRYHRRHSFDHYMLFAVSSEDKPAIKGTEEKNPVQNP